MPTEELLSPQLYFLSPICLSHKMKLSPEEGLKKLADSGRLFTELFHHGSLSVEVYRPIDQDLQTPHDRDEIYIIISGYGDFISDGQQYSFGEGDFFFVQAGVEHHFENFSEDFSTWVIFFGPKGGEADTPIDQAD